MEKIVIVTPIFEDAEASSQLFKELGEIYRNEAYVVAVDDGSVKQPQTAASLRAAGLKGVVLRLRRNVGHQRAIAIGLSYVADKIPDADFTVVMDSDGEDLPSSIPELIQAARSAEVDMAVSQRKSRIESWKFKAFYAVYRRLFRLFTGRKISFGNFMALKPAALQRLTFMSEIWTHVAASVLVSRLRVAVCPLDRGSRYAGKSKMNFVGLALHGFRAFMVFAEDVLVRVGIWCTGLGAVAIAGMVGAVVLKVSGLASPGWFSILFATLAVVLLQTITLGLMALMSLMQTGVAKTGAGADRNYHDFIAFVDE